MKTLAPTSRRGMRRVRSVFLFAFVLVVAAATLRAQGTAVRVETFPLKPNGEVAVENPRGATRVETWDYQTVRVVAEKKGPAESSMQPGELVLMGAQNSIIVQCKQGAGRIDLTIYVPNSARLQVTGGVWPVDISGALATAVIDTTSGNIAYRLPANDDARVAMRSALGTVRSTVPLTAVERIGTRSLQGQLGNGTAQLILNSQSGNITLTPAPNSPAIARAAKSESGVSAAKTQPSRGEAAESEADNQRGSEQRTNGTSTPMKRDPVSQDDSDIGDPGAASRPAQSNGSVVFAGSDRSNDSSSTTTSGPISRPRTERNTSGGNSDLKVRIIRSNAPPRGSRDAAGSIYDQANDETRQDTQSPASGSSPGSRASKASGGANPASGTVDFAGTDRADSATGKARVGPLERDLQTKNTSGGNSGLRVRIIPADSPPGASRSSSSVFDNRDEPTQAPASAGASTRTSPQTGSGQVARSSDYARQGSSARSADATARADDEIASTNSRAGAPPTLHRSRAEDSPVTNEPEAKAKNPDEEAIVLKAALVSLNVSVTNRAGVALANLKKEDFEVAENSEPQKIEFFQPTAAPFNLVLVLDLSGSIKDKIDVVKSAALRFVEILGPQDKIAVVTFTDEIRVVTQLTNDREELKRRIRLIDRSQGGTAFYEALWFSLMDTLRGTRGQRSAIVVMTDGVDSSLDRYNPMESRVSFDQLARRFEESDVLVFPIYLDTEYEEVFERGNSSSEAYAVARDQLDRIGELTGGQSFKAEKVGDLSGVYKQVAAAIRTVYSVGYYPTNPERDGTFRRVRVGVNRADAAVRTRKGYYAK
ncbi:MAG: VWA domain-containing protein [Acidobacteriota bacterium]